MNPDIPTVDEILDCYNDKCAEQTCENCKLSLGSTSDSTNECAIRYTVAVLTGEMELGDSFRKEKPKPEPKPEPKLPPWCKANTWVTEGDPSNRLGVIDKVLSDGRVSVTWFHKSDGFTGSYSFTKYLKPVRFRPYTFEEAKGLLGKVMEHNEDGVLPAVAIIGMVWLDGSEVYYNSFSFKDLQSWNATIDGVPLGVPEIDNEALKGDEK